MSSLLARRIGFIVGLVVLSFITYFAWRLLQVSLQPDSICTGLLLFFLVLALTLFNGRKKLPFLPLVKAATWLQIHLYAGWFSLFIFLLHLHFRIPRGPFEVTLALTFCVVILSGIFGLYISRALPPRMARGGEALLYERMPAFRRHIQRNVEDLIRQAESETESSTLGNFYVESLRRFFTRVPSAFSALAGAEPGMHPLMGEISALSRYLDDREKAIANEIRDWIETKQNLDLQYSCQRLLKLWLFVHIPFTYSLILLGLAHGVIATLYAARW